MSMNPGMKMLMMDRMRQQNTENRSEYGGGNRRMIGYDRSENGNANVSNYGGMEGGGGSRNYAENRMEGGSRNYAENRMEGGGGSSNYGRNRMEYGMEEMENRRRRDSRGRFMEGGNEIQNGRYTNYPWSEEMAGGGYETESRRRRDSRGRYMMNRMEDDDEETEMRGQRWYPPSGRMPPNMHGGYGDIYAEGTIYAPNAMNRPGMMGGMEQEWAKPVDERTARMWVSEMDGGEKFKPEQIEQLRQAVCPECSKWEFFVSMNSMYSDFCETAKKMGVDKPEFYAYLAKDFLKDKDAKPHKLRRYMEHIAK